MDGVCNGKASNVALSPRRLTGLLYVVKLSGPTNNKFTHAHMNDIGMTALESPFVQIESSQVRFSSPTWYL